MAKYRIAWMPGDGVGNDVMEATRIVLDRMKFDAEYVPCDIGWKFWCTEGNALPDRTVKALKDTTCALFGAITSKAQDKAKEELSPELKGKGLSYFSPIVGLRQLFNLHTNMNASASLAIAARPTAGGPLLMLIELRSAKNAATLSELWLHHALA